MTFDELQITPRFLQLLKAQEITEPTPIQAAAVPPALEGRDLVAIAQTGTGKTLAFALPALTRLADLPNRAPRNAMLVLTPTRELAHQVHSVVDPLAKAAGLRTACIYGGVGMDRQTQTLRRGCSIVVATPGRLLDHMERGNVRFDQLSILVLDEADRMLDMGFMPDIRRILRSMPRERQTMMFSATFPREIEQLASSMQQDPVRVESGPVAKPTESVRQGVYTVVQTQKLDLLTQLLDDPSVRSALVFLRTKHRTDRVARALHARGLKVQAIHGGRSQGQRQQAIDGFRQGRYRILLATDIAARGLDVKGVTHVVNYDVPATSEDYIHRIGRTARASAEGDALTFVSPEECMALGTIERALGRNLPRHEWEGAVPVMSLYKEENDISNSPRRRRPGRSLLRRR